MKLPLAKFVDHLRRSPRVARLRSWLSQSYKDLHAKGRSYWLLAAFLLPSGMLIGHGLGTHSFWVGARYYVYNILQKASAHPLNASTRTVVVLIGDEEFWNGELARRTPLKRDYLACLLLKLDQANPAVIALDIDLGFKHPDYERETIDLLAAVQFVANYRPVVISNPISRGGFSFGVSPPPTGHSNAYESQPTVLSHYQSKNIRYGHVLLPEDVRQVPLKLSLKDGTTVDSFAAAIADAVDDTALIDAESGDSSSLPYGTFIPPERFKRISAKQVFETDAERLKELLAAKAVLVGGAWRVNLFENRQVDTHPTPVGEIGGVFVHANYVEALLTHRVSQPVGKVFGVIIEFLLAVFIAVVFAWKMKPSLKFAWAIGLSLILIVITYVFWQNLGLFFDFFIPLILLGGHAFTAQVIEWRDEAHAFKAA